MSKLSKLYLTILAADGNAWSIPKTLIRTVIESKGKTYISCYDIENNIVRKALEVTESTEYILSKLGWEKKRKKK